MGAEAGDELLCILFTDLVGWTELGDRAGDDAAHLLRRDHFAAVRAALDAHRGHEVKTAGDSVMATFRSALDAVRCAVGIQEATATTSLRVRIGVHAGETITDDNDVFGTPVNLASRLCSAAGPGEVLLSDLTRSLLGRRGGFDLEDTGALQLKGLSEPVRAFRLRAAAGATPPRPAPVPAPREPTAALERAERSLLCPVVIERERQFDTLRSAVEGLGGATGGIDVLVGEAGVGKTRLARETCTLARSGGLTVLSGRAVPGASPVPYRPLTEAFLPAFRSARPTEAPELAGFGGQLGRLVPSWGTGTPGGADESPVLLGEAVVRLLRLVSGAEHQGRSGCVLLLEDLHWADVETLAVVEYLADALREEPVLCLCTTRPEGAAVPLLARLRRSAGVTVLGLERLSRGGVERVVASCLDAEAAPADVLDCIASNSEGNPFLVRSLARRGRFPSWRRSERRAPPVASWAPMMSAPVSTGDRQAAA